MDATARDKHSHKRKKIKPQVEEARDVKPRHNKVGAKREKGDALVIQTEQSKYSEVFKVMMSDDKVVDLGADVPSIRRIRTCEMIPELKRDKKRKGRRLQKTGGRCT